MTIRTAAVALARALAAWACILGSAPAGSAIGLPAAAASEGASALLREYAAQRPRLEDSPYGRPLALDSREFSHHLEGDAYAVFAHPFGRVEQGLAPAAQWCEILLLPANTKHCQAEDRGGASRLLLFVGRKDDTPIRDAYRLDFRYAVLARAPDYMKLSLRSGAGPLGTRDYRIVLEAAPLDARRTVVKLSYSYGYGTLSRMAMQAYLATFGADKVGFTVEGRDGEGRPRLVRGMRGVMERNTMRYALAIDAYLASLDAPPPERVPRRLHDWFTAIERYPRQLRESDREDYVAMKEREYARMHAGDCCKVASR